MTETKRKPPGTEVDRADLLAALELCEPGLPSKVQFQQAGMVALRKGLAYSYNDECLCRVKTGLPLEVVGATLGKPLLEVLRKMKDEIVGVGAEDGFLVLATRLDTVKVQFERDIVLPVEGVEKPDGQWLPLKPSFCEALAMVGDCCGKESERFELQCVHIHPDYLEGCDNYRIIRHKTKTRVGKGTMVLNSAMRHVVKFSPTQVCATENWLHYAGDDKANRIAVRKYHDPYPEFDGQIDMGDGGDAFTIPTALVEGLELAEVFSAEDKDNNDVVVTLGAGKASVTGTGAVGQAVRRCKAEYAGPEVSFKIPVKALRGLAGAKRECVVRGLKMNAYGERWVYHACLNPAGGGANGQG